MNRRLAVILIVFGCFSFTFGFVYKYHLPKLKAWLLVEVERQSTRHLPVRIWPQELNLSLLPLGIELKNVRLLPQGPLKEQLAPAEIKSADAYISILGLIQGRMRLSLLRFSGTEIKYFTPEIKQLKQKDHSQSQSDQKKKKDVVIPIWKYLSKVPIDKVSIDDVNVYIRVSSPKLSLRIKSLSIDLDNHDTAMVMSLDTPRIQIKKTKEDPVLDIRLSTRFLLEEEHLNLTALKVAKGTSYLLASGVVKGQASHLKYRDSHLQLRTRFDVQEVRRMATEFFPGEKIINGRGQLKLEGEFKHKIGEVPIADFKLQTEKTFIDGFEIGDLNATGSTDGKNLTLKKADFRHSAGHASIINGQFNLTENRKFSATVRANKLEIGKLLDSIKVENVPIYLLTSGELPCHGNIYPKTRVRCDGRLSVKDLHVDNGKSKPDEIFNIVDIPEVAATGFVEVTDTNVKYNAKLNLPTGSGSSSGVIDYKKGFDIKYSAQIKRIEDIQNIAQLKMAGAIEIAGSTKGTSQWATIDMNLDTDTFWLNDYGIGDVKTHVNYKRGILSFREINGTWGATRYSGEVSLNLKKNSIFVKGQLPFIALKNVEQILAKKIELPFKMTGTGNAQIKLWGPLKVSQLNFDLNSQVFRGVIAEEPYDRLDINLEARNGNIRSKKTTIRRASSVVELKGVLNNQGNLESVVVGRGIRPEELGFVQNHNLNISGQLDFTATLNGPIKSPTTNLNGRMSQTVLANRSVEDSTFSAVIDEKSLRGEGKLFGDVVQSKFRFPLQVHNPFQFSLTAEGWDYTHILGLFASGGSGSKGYSGEVSGKIDLRAPSGGFWNSTGTVQFNEFSIARGPLTMAAKAPMFAQFDNGKISLKQFKLEGKENFFELSGDEITRQDFTLTANGKVDLLLANILVPFIEDLRGKLSLTINFKGPIDSVGILGSAYIQEGLVRLPGFPHSFENIKSDILFSQQNILINALKANLGGGEISAGGKVVLAANGQIPVEVNGLFKGVSLNIPEGFQTKGSGTLDIRGERPPYLLSGQYNVTYGNIIKDLAKSKSTETKIRPSSYLPEFLSKTKEDPIHLDLGINLRNPVKVRMAMGGAGLLIDTTVEGAVTVKGPPTEPTMDGQFTAQRGGQVTFRSNDFEVLSGRVTYKSSPADNPELFVSAETRVHDYDISLLVQGSARAPGISMSSQPPLIEKEIISLLALGMTPDQLEEEFDSDQQLDQTSLQIGSTLIKEGLSGMGLGNIDNKLGLEFDVSSAMDEDSNENVPTVTIRKKFNPRFGVSGSQTWGTNQKRLFKAEFKVNRNLSLIGSLEQQDATSQSSQEDTGEQYGLDLEYRVQFK